MNILDMVKKKKKLLSDLIYTVGASVLMNGVLQLIIYPFINYRMGEEYLGNVVFYMSIVSIIGQAMGMSFCSNRLVLRNQCRTTNGDFNALLRILAPLGGLVGAVIFSFYTKNVGEILAFGLIVMFTVLRYYANVEYRLKLNYKKYFLYFVILTAGYGIGAVIYAFTGQWFWIFLTGEVIATLYMFVFGTIFKKEARTDNTRFVAKHILFLLLSYLVFEGISNADRMILKSLLDAKAVALFYVVSMIGKTLQLFVGPINNIALSYMSADKKKMTREDFLKTTLLYVGVGAAFYLVCLVGTPLYVRLLYPNLYGDLKGLNLVVNAGQVINFAASLILPSILASLGSKYHMMLQVLYAVVYLPLAIVFTMQGGIWGFAFATLIANSLRLIELVVFGMRKLPRAAEAGRMDE